MFHRCCGGCCGRHHDLGPLESMLPVLLPPPKFPPGFSDLMGIKLPAVPQTFVAPDGTLVEDEIVTVPPALLGDS